MSAKVTGMVFERYPVGGGEMLLALALADHAHDDGTHIFPSIASLAVKTRQSERAVQYQLRRMEASGWLLLVNDGKGGRRRGSSERGLTREYRINPAWMKGADLAPLEEGAPAAKGADFAPIGKGANGDGKGCKSRQERVQNDAFKGAKLLHPNQKQPSITIREPSSSAHARDDDDAMPRLTQTEIDAELAGLGRIPAALDREVLARFVRHRRVGRRPLSISAWLELLPRFSALQAQGHDLNLSLRQTMAAGLYLPVTPTINSSSNSHGQSESLADQSARQFAEQGGAAELGEQRAGPVDDVIDAEWHPVDAAYG
ncbi:helix-turn-helix domain-containing protein [[Pseudomonas] boreopolis]|uniref:Helix-turn-helix domain-containing protein n=1 Tax=Xanthomonas boreopolis TaxID=86183 RepID=A0A919F7W4_9XANT|nr:hypothetical protein GCM10009090_16340 [[Pseudomonas] boreopolis]